MVMSDRTREMLAQRAMQRDAERQESRNTLWRRTKKFTKVAFLTTAAAVAGIFGAKALGEKLSQENKETENQNAIRATAYPGRQLVRHEQEQVVIENETIKEVVKEVPVYVEVEKPVYVEQQTPAGAYYTEVETPTTVVVNQGPTFGEIVTGNIIGAGLHALFHHHSHPHHGGYRAPSFHGHGGGHSMRAPAPRGGCAPRVHRAPQPHRVSKPVCRPQSRPVCRPSAPARTCTPRRPSARPCGTGARR